ncbi:MAG TPA: peptidoglycan recognition protein [Nitriliruptorales bacterium]|nr:peptidoglycan recognition protein [Nitriliruptorales bacterium]
MAVQPPASSSHGAPRAARTAARIATLIGLTGLLTVPATGLRTPPAPTSSTDEHVVAGWSAPDRAGWRRSAPVAVHDLVLLGAGWGGDPGVTLEVRARRDQSWGRWLPVALDADTDHSAPGVSDPVWLGRSDGFQLRTRGGSPPVAVTTVAMGGHGGLAHDPLARRAGAAAAVPSTPAVVTRDQWDPHGECRPRAAPEYGHDLQMAYVHHTVVFPHYEPEEADDVVRAICLAHVEQRGWRDVGYNFLVDRFGRIYEGRAGGMARPVVGAHASGFNDQSVGVAVIGDYDTNPVPPAALEAVSVVIAWKAALHGFDPNGWAEVVASDGAHPRLSRHPAGTLVAVPAVSGHLDTAVNTECPGRHLYLTIPAIRSRAAQLATSWPEVQPETTTPTDGAPTSGPVEPVELLAAPPFAPPGGPPPQPDPARDSGTRWLWELTALALTGSAAFRGSAPRDLTAPAPALTGSPPTASGHTPTDGAAHERD